MADWSLLRSALNRVDRSVTYSWDELDTLIGGLPASATNHRAWWSGDRPHVNAWRLAGFTVTGLALGQEVTFVRTEAVSGPSTGLPEPSRGAERRLVGIPGESDLLLVTCVKEKRTSPAPARDLYASPLFKKERAYAERAGLPWFILSAEHGLVAPDEWLAPYERYLPDTPGSFRTAWGNWVTERLELLAGPLKGLSVEVHAGGAYVDALRAPMSSKGATLIEPLAGLTMGQRLAWYGRIGSAGGDAHEREAVENHDALDRFCDALSTPGSAVSPSAFIAGGAGELAAPGLYSWWVDEEGAKDLSAGLGLPVSAGLVYAGLAGATRWPSGRASSNTLWSRISGMHLGGRHEFSTFRRSLGSILAHASDEATIDEDRLTAWMHEHLRVVAVPFDDPDTLGRLEEDVLRRLDPPLNLKGMPSSKLRLRLKELRRPYARRRRGVVEP